MGASGHVAVHSSLKSPQFVLEQTVFQSSSKIARLRIPPRLQEMSKCFSYLYILDIILLQDVQLVKKFSHSVVVHIVQLMVSFVVHKLFNFMRIQLIFFLSIMLLTFYCKSLFFYLCFQDDKQLPLWCGRSLCLCAAFIGNKYKNFFEPIARANRTGWERLGCKLGERGKNHREAMEFPEIDAGNFSQ